MINYGSAEEKQVQTLDMLGGKPCTTGGQLDWKTHTWKRNIKQKLKKEQRLSSAEFPVQHSFELLMWYEESKIVLSFCDL